MPRAPRGRGPAPVNKVEAALRDIVRVLAGMDRACALVGGLAVSVRCEPRFTRDVDLAVVVADDRDGEALVHRLVEQGYTVLATVEQEERKRLATVRLTDRAAGTEGVVVDLLLASSGIEAEIVREAETLDVFPGVVVPVARTGHLLATKLLSRSDRRPQDAADIVALLREMGPAERQRARDAVGLIAERGFHRGRDLGRDAGDLLGG